jgi:hypothetical protein
MVILFKNYLNGKTKFFEMTKKQDFCNFREIKLERKPDACRLHGTLEVNKLAGNFHIILGK